MRLKASLPKDELNGLTIIAQKAQKLGTKVLVVGLVESIEVTDALDKPGKDVKFALERVEVVDSADEALVAGMIEDQFQSRTGKTPLDLDIEGAEDLRRRYRPKGDRKAKGEPTVFAEPSAIEPLKLDSAVLHPDEDPDVIDAEVEDEGADDADEPVTQEWLDQISPQPTAAEEDADDEDAEQESRAPEFSDR